MTSESDFATAIAAAETLAGVIEDENRVLAASDFSRSTELAEAKQAAIARMEGLLSKIAAFPASQRDSFAVAQKRLDAAVTANRALLRTAIATQQRVISTVVQALDAKDGARDVPAQYGQSQAGRPVEPVALVLRA